MLEIFPTKSAAIGFWVKHQEAMETFVYEDEEEQSVPDELKKIFENDRYRELLDRINDVSTDEGDALVHAIATNLIQQWKQNSNLVVTRKRAADDWRERFSVRRKRARQGEAAEIGVLLETNPKLRLTLYVFLWTKGGKAAAEFNAQCIREATGGNVLKGSDDHTRYWHNGIILLARIPLDGFMQESEVDCTALYEEAVKQVSRCTPEALVRILEKKS